MQDAPSQEVIFDANCSRVGWPCKIFQIPKVFADGRQDPVTCPSSWHFVSFSEPRERVVDKNLKNKFTMKHEVHEEKKTSPP